MKALKQIKRVKEIVGWLNEEHGLSRQGEKQFIGYLIKGDSLDVWHVACVDYWLYVSDECKASMEAIREAYPDLKVVFVALNFLQNWVIKKRMEMQNGKPVILVR